MFKIKITYLFWGINPVALEIDHNKHIKRQDMNVGVQRQVFKKKLNILILKYAKVVCNTDLEQWSVL